MMRYTHQNNRRLIEDAAMASEIFSEKELDKFTKSAKISKYAKHLVARSCYKDTGALCTISKHQAKRDRRTRSYRNQHGI